VAANKKHEAWLRFQRDVLNVPIGWSKEDLFSFLALAEREASPLAPIIHGYLNLAHRSDSPAKSRPPGETKRGRPPSKQMHLFDLLREKTFFPQNLDLSRFASRVVPNMRVYRFDKMSRSDIAARIIEYIENTDPRTRKALETSMREALEALHGRPTKEVDRQSFLSRWEAIIKGTAT
jgi:hypothetical protein